MVQDTQPTKRKRKTGVMKKENSDQELTFLYVLDCLQESITAQQFLGFTLSADYVPVHKSRSEELSKLQEYFRMEVLQTVVVWSVHGQIEKVIKWTDREAMEDYLRSNGAK